MRFGFEDLQGLQFSGDRVDGGARLYQMEGRCVLWSDADGEGLENLRELRRVKW